MNTKIHPQNLLITGYSSESSSASPPASPRRSARVPHCHRRLRKKCQARSSAGNATWFIFRRYFRLLLLAPLVYISGILLCIGTVSIVAPLTLPGSVYRSGEAFRKLWPAMQLDNDSAIELTTIWKYGKRKGHWKPCASQTLEYSGLPAPSSYLIVEANGGLNQQRSSICNAVAVAGLLNATLLVPQLHFHSIWKDPSEFRDIYDEDHFIQTLKGHVRVVKELPEILMERFDNNMSNIPNVKVKAWAPISYYLGVVYPVLLEQGVIRITPFANRLALEVPPNIQILRCLANYEALRFSVPIATLAKKIVNRMITRSSRTDGKYVSVHLRFEEVGMMLRGMGFDNNTTIYLASGEIYQAERNLAPLLQMFPLLENKETIAAQEELAPFEGFSSRLAALDYYVCLFSEVFVTTQGGNFPHFLMGHRRYLYNGHAKTIKPDKPKLAVLLQDLSVSWETFKEEMGTMLMESVREGFSLRKKGRSIYTHPTPECMCYSRAHAEP